MKRIKAGKLKLSSNIRYPHTYERAKMPGTGYGKMVKHIGTISASCKRNQCCACSKLDCPHQCHKEELN